MKANDASGITKEKNSSDTVVGTEVKTESKNNARKNTPKTSKKSTVKPIEKIVEKAVEKDVISVKDPEKVAPTIPEAIESPKASKGKEAKAKTEAKKTTAKKTTTKKVTSKKTSAAKTDKDKTEKKAARKSTQIKKEFYFQYLGQQIDEESLLHKVKTDCNNQGITVKEIKLYLKPEDNTCYYVANGNIAGKVELY